MHVGVNLLYLVPGETGGMEVYGRELVDELAGRSPQISLTAFVSREGAALQRSWGDSVRVVVLGVNARNRAARAAAENLVLPRAVEHAGVDVLHSLASTGPAWGRFRRVVTIHDLAYRLTPDTHSVVLGAGLRVLVPLAARASHRIIVDATSTRDDLRRFLNVPTRKIDVVPLGVRVAPRAATTTVTETRARLDTTDRPLVLSASAKRPHKNLMRLLDALARIPLERRPVLVLPGYHTDHEQELKRRAAELRITSDVRFLGWVGDDELESLYSAADCFVFPSLLEGFGLPVLEAMARGVPVACSNRGSVAEVAGAAALRFDPFSAVEIADAIERLIDDRATAERLRAAGYQRAAMFTWFATAEGTIAAYERATLPRP